MFPRLSDLINYLLGTEIELPVNSYGLMLAMAFFSGGFVLWMELRRKELNGQIHSHQEKVLKGGPPSLQEILIFAFLGFIIGWKGLGIILDYSGFLKMPQEYIFSGKGNIGGALVLATLFAGINWLQIKKKQLKKPLWVEETVHPYQLTPMIVLIAAVFGILGAKIFDMMEHLDDLLKDPVGTLLSFDGLAFYGGLIVATFAVLWYNNRNKIRYPLLLDAAAPALIMAYAIGRIGCQLSGDGCWGVTNAAAKPGWLAFLPDWAWSFRYPHNVINEGMQIAGCTGPYCHVLLLPVFPAPLYETILGLCIFGILWGIRKKLLIPGQLFCIYLILNGFERFFIERIRINIVYNFYGIHLTQAEMVAIMLILTGGFGLWFTKMKNEKLKMKNYQ